MRSLTNSLYLTQNDTDCAPYVRVYVNSTEYLSTARVLAVVQHENAYEDGADILLSNHDQAFKAANLLGYELNLGFGMGNEYSNVPDLYVIQQEDISICGKLFTRLVCTGNWGRLNIHKVMGDAIAAAPSTGSDTVAQIIEGGGAGDAMLLSGMTLLDDEESGEAASKAPELKFEVFDSRAKVIRTSVELTDNVVFMRGGDMRMVQNATGQQHRLTGTLTGELTAGETLTGSNSTATCKFVYQTVASGAGYIVVEDVSGTIETSENMDGATQSCDNLTAIDDEHYLYELDGNHTFWENTRIQSLLKANRVMCVDKLPDTDGTQHTYSGTVNDTNDQAVFGISTFIFQDPSVTSNAEAETSATNMLKRFQAEASGGVLKTPMNCGQEMYDIVKVTDSRAGWESGTELELRVGGIERRYHAFTGEYTTTLTFGGLVTLKPDSIPVEEVIPPEPEDVDFDDFDFEQPPVHVPPESRGKTGWKYLGDTGLKFPPIPEAYPQPPGLGATVPVEAPMGAWDRFMAAAKERLSPFRGTAPSPAAAPSLAPQPGWEPTRGFEPQPDWGGSVTAPQGVPAFPGDTGPKPIAEQIPLGKIGKLGATVLGVAATVGGIISGKKALEPRPGRLAPVPIGATGASVPLLGEVSIISKSEQEEERKGELFTRADIESKEW